MPGERILRRGNQVLPLPPKAFETLLLLVRNPGHLMRKEDLMTALWPDSFVEEVSLASKISLLRKVLADAGAAGDYIQTVPKQGYRFLPPVTRTWASGPAVGTPIQVEGEAPAERVIRFIALPFRVLNGDERAGFLEHSLPEAISASLAGLRSLTVRSSLLAARLAEANPDPRHIAREADVDMLLTGTILCEGDQVRVSAELIHAPSGTLVGSYVCKTRLDNLIEVQDSLVRGIVELLVLRLTERERRVLAHNVPASARAYEFYLRANHVALSGPLRACRWRGTSTANAWTKTRTTLRRGRVWEVPSVPGETRRGGTAGSGIGEVGLPPRICAESRPAHRAQPVHVDRGRFRARPGGHGAAPGARRDIPTIPSCSRAWFQSCRYCGLLDESIRAHERARRLDSRIVTSVAFSFFLRGDYERAIEWYPPGTRFYMDLAALAAAGRESEAAELIGQRIFPGGKWPEIEALRCSLRGDHAGSIDIAMQALVTPSVLDPEGTFCMARQLAYDGAPSEALRTVRTAATQGFVCSTALRNDPWLRPLSRLPDFQDLLDEVLSREADARAAFQAAGGDRVLA